MNAWIALKIDSDSGKIYVVYTNIHIHASGAYLTKIAENFKKMFIHKNLKCLWFQSFWILGFRNCNTALKPTYTFEFVI